MKEIKSIYPRTIPTNLLLCVSGGAEKNEGSSQPSTSVNMYISGSSDGAAGKVGVTVPVAPDVTVSPHISGNTTNKVTGGGANINYAWD